MDGPAAEGWDGRGGFGAGGVAACAPFAVALLTCAFVAAGAMGFVLGGGMELDASMGDGPPPCADTACISQLLTIAASLPNRDSFNKPNLHSPHQKRSQQCREERQLF